MSAWDIVALIAWTVVGALVGAGVGLLLTETIIRWDKRSRAKRRARNTDLVHCYMCKTEVARSGLWAHMQGCPPYQERLSQWRQSENGSSLSPATGNKPSEPTATSKQPTRPWTGYEEQFGRLSYPTEQHSDTSRVNHRSNVYLHGVRIDREHQLVELRFGQLGVNHTLELEFERSDFVDLYLTVCRTRFDLDE